MKSSSSVVFKGTQAHFHTLHWFWGDAISLYWNPTLDTQGFFTNSSGTESSKHNVPYCTYIKITFKRIWHSPTKDFGTPAPHPACLWHPGEPARPSDNIHAQKSLTTQDTKTGNLSQRRKRERAEHRTQAPHLDSLQFLLTLQLPQPRWAPAAECSGAAGHFPYPRQMPQSLGCPTPGCLSLSAGQRQLPWTNQASPTPGPPAMPCWTAHLGFTFSLFFPLISHGWRAKSMAMCVRNKWVISQQPGTVSDNSIGALQKEACTKVIKKIQLSLLQQHQPSSKALHKQKSSFINYLFKMCSYKKKNHFFLW